MSPLTDVLPALWRKRLYFLFACAGVIVGGLQVGYASSGADQPSWLNVALAVLAYAGVALGFTAASNTNAQPAPVEEDPEAGHGDLVTVCVVLLAFIALLWVFGAVPR